MKHPTIYNSTQLAEFIQEVGFLPLLNSCVPGFSAEEIVEEECRYNPDSSDGFYWPLWMWKGQIVTDSECVYGKFFDKKAGFVSRDWWPDLCNYRRSLMPPPSYDSIEGVVLNTLKDCEELITRELRAECGFNGPKMRSKFDAYVTRLEMGTYIVTKDFVYPHDKHGRQYGWGWSLLTTPERLYGPEACQCERTPEESLSRLTEHLQHILPEASEKQIKKLIG